MRAQAEADVYNPITKSSETIILDSRDIGSCTVVSFRKHKYILTNAHVVTPPSQVTVMIQSSIQFPVPAIQMRIVSVEVYLHTNPEIAVKVTPKYLNSDVDLALLVPMKKDSYKKIKAVSLGNENDIEVTDPVTNIGNPMRLQFIFNSGNISKILKFKEGNQEYTWIITTPMTEGGSSGSPLLNEKRRCIGINKGYFNQRIPYSVFIHVRDVKKYLRSIPEK